MRVRPERVLLRCLGRCRWSRRLSPALRSGEPPGGGFILCSRHLSPLAAKAAALPVGRLAEDKQQSLTLGI